MYANNIPEPLVEAIKSGNCVAFVGAGFSIPAKLPSWATLLRNIVDNVEKENLITDNDLLKFLRNTIDDAFTRGSSDAYDLAAQLLEDNITTQILEQMVSDQLKIPRVIPEEMAKRMELLKSIPFKAIVTTNFYLFIQGLSPFSSAYAATENPYADVLRRGSTEGLQLSIDENVREEIKAEGNLFQLFSETCCMKTSKQRPIIQLHGTLADTSAGTTAGERTLVWTRTGYRKLLHQTPGYMNFLRSLLSTSTVLYMGFSFSDLYLNDLRGEVLSMLYGDVDRRHGADYAIERPPIGYAIVNDKNDYEKAFFKKHEGVELLSWNTNTGEVDKQGRPKRDFSGFDKYLTAIQHKVSLTHHLGRVMFGKRLLIIEYKDSAFIKVIEFAYKSFNGELQTEGKFEGIDVVYSVDEAVEKLKQVSETTDSSIKPYDVIISVFGEDRSGNNAHVWKRVVEEMRKLPAKSQSPFIVYATKWNAVARRRLCMRHGAFAFATSFIGVVESVTSLLDETRILDMQTSEEGMPTYENE